jgi:hypothetical protein
MRSLVTLALAGCGLAAGLALWQLPDPALPWTGLDVLGREHPVPLSRGNAIARAEYERLKLRDPATGEIPRGIRSREQAFARRVRSVVHKDARVYTEEWEYRGPVNIGGRTRALVLDNQDSLRLLAGSVSGALYESLDRGANWQRLTAMEQLPGVTCLVQDPREGRGQTWYYGTGEYVGSGSRSINSRVPGYFGDGIFKSQDGGHSWTQLASTATTPSSFGSPFDVVFDIVVDTQAQQLDRLYAACYGCVMRSDDGGESWTTALGQFQAVGSAWTSVYRSPDGSLFAALASPCANAGLWHSTDGESWSLINPEGWPQAWNRVVFAAAPSDPDQVYVLGETPNAGYIGSGGSHSLWSWRIDTNEWEDRSQNLPNLQGEVQLPFGYDYGSQGGYDMCIAVKPDDPEAVFIGGTTLFRSTDGFRGTQPVRWIGGYNYYYGLLAGPEGEDVSYPNHHADVHALLFDPGNPDRLWSSHDGGISRGEQALFEPDSQTPFPWVRSEGYPTTQFYWVSLDKHMEGSHWILGGMQDNGTWMAVDEGSLAPWANVRGGDGMACAIGDYSQPNQRALYASTQYGGSFIQGVVDLDGNFIDGAWLTPPADMERWITPYFVDPADHSRMALAATHELWLNDNLYSNPGDNWRPVSASSFPDGWLTALGLSQQPAGRIYYGVYEGGDVPATRVIRLDDAWGDDPLPMEVTPLDLPMGGWIHGITVNPLDAEEVIVVVTNYGVQSVFHTTDGGIQWTAVGGNLEEFPDGSGAGPSCYAAAIVHRGDSPLYLLGTSTGLWSTRTLAGAQTEWQLEGAETIGTVWVTALDVRQSDGTVAVGTHGHGVFSGVVQETGSGPDRVAEALPTAFRMAPLYPNPFNGLGRLELELRQAGTLTLSLYDLRGARVAGLYRGTLGAGRHQVPILAQGLASGSYVLRAELGGQVSSQRISLVK